MEIGEWRERNLRWPYSRKISIGIDRRRRKAIVGRHDFISSCAVSKEGIMI